MKEIKIALVGYLNTKPFEYGLKKLGAQQFNIYYDTPARCARLYEEGVVDIALVPVGALLQLDGYRIVTDTCIGCDDYVRTVVLMGNTPVEQWRRVSLDSHSRTSALLSQIVVNQKVEHGVSYESQQVAELNTLAKDQGVLMIGDKVFEVEDDYEYKYDLGHEWREMTDLPFAYAVWIAKPYITDEDVAELNKCLAYGMNNLDAVIAQEEINQPNFSLDSYYRDNIDYVLDDKKRKAIDLYLSKARKL